MPMAEKKAAPLGNYGDIEADVKTWEKNWGKWGPDDQKGSLNYVTPEVTLNALKLVKEGKVYNLAVPMQRRSPIFPGHDPIIYSTMRDGGDYKAGYARYASPDVGVFLDRAMMETNTYTHCDALNHVWFGDKLYNGYSRDCVRSDGSSKLGIEHMTGVVTRGVLLDVAAYEGVDFLDGNYEITGDILDKVAKWEKVEIKTGDMLCIRTGFGWELMEKEEEKPLPPLPHPGLVLSAAKWATDREVCALFIDCVGMDKAPFPPRPCALACHMWLEWAHGTYGGQAFYFAELSKDKVYTFCFMGAPVRIVGAAGGWIVPLAIK